MKAKRSEDRGKAYELREVGGMVVLRIRPREYVQRRYPGGARSAILGFSDDSRRRMVRYLRSCKAEYQSFGTLTYPALDAPSNGRQVKDDWRAFVERLRRSGHVHMRGEEPFSMFWFLEFTTRGIPHIHFFANQFIPREWMAKAWAGVVGSDDPRHVLAGTSIQSWKSGKSGIATYASKYASKAEQKDPGKYAEGVGRYWGVVGSRITVSADTLVAPATELGEEVCEEAFAKIRRILACTERAKGAKVILDRGSAIFVCFTWNNGVRAMIRSVIEDTVEKAMIADMKWRSHAAAHVPRGTYCDSFGEVTWWDSMDPWVVS